MPDVDLAHVISPLISAQEWHHKQCGHLKYHP